ncbi:retrovirus-related pol polyprotein from transposon TNT 1-94 [Tanacetum coccineum]
MVSNEVLMRSKAVVYVARPKAVLNVVKGNQVNVVKASACWVWKPKTKVLDHVSKHNSASITLKKFDYGNPQIDLQDQGVIDSGYSRHMTGNMFYLTDFEEIDGGYVAFGAERKNRTLIEAARTMLADSKLPTTFWAEAFNTACYVQNRVLVTKPHNKIPYELFLGRKPALGFMRPFGCPVIILNTIDHLGKFDGTKARDDAGKARMETVLGKDYILLPLWPADQLFSHCSKNSLAGFNPSSDGKKKVDGDPSKEDESNDQEKDDNVNNTNNVNTASDGNNTNNVNDVSSTVNAVG